MRSYVTHFYVGTNVDSRAWHRWAQVRATCHIGVNVCSKVSSASEQLLTYPWLRLNITCSNFRKV